MERPVRRLLYWTPRVLCLLFAAFISIFALDVFGHGGTVWQTLVALLIHLVPTYLVIAVLVLSWRREWLGGVLFIGLAALYLAWAWKRPFFGWAAGLAIPGPLVVTGLLFLLNWKFRSELRADGPSAPTA